MERKCTIKKILAGDLMMLAATIIFGAMTIFSKQILAELEVYNLVALRFLIAFAVCLVVFHRRYRSLSKTIAVHAGIIGTLLFISFTFMAMGCKYTTASNAGFMMSLVAFFTPFIIFAQEKIPPSKIQLISVVITLIGVGLMCLTGGQPANKGDLLCVASAFFYSFQMIYTERYAKVDDPILLGTFQLLFVSVEGFLFAFLFEDKFILPVSPAGWWQLLYLAIACGAIAFALQTYAEKNSPTSHTTLIYASEPVFVAIFSFMLLGEQITIRQMIGIVIVFIGVWITVRPQKQIKNQL